MKRKGAKRLRQEIEAHGSIEVSFEAIEEWSGESMRSPLGRSKINEGLEAMGLVTEPTLSTSAPQSRTLVIYRVGEAAPASGAATAIQAGGEVKAEQRAKKEAQKAEGARKKVEAKAAAERAKAAEQARIRAELIKRFESAAAKNGNIKNQEAALAAGLAFARKHDGVFNKAWETFFNTELDRRQRSGAIERGDYIGNVEHVLLLKDRIVLEEQGQAERERRELAERLREAEKDKQNLSETPASSPSYLTELMELAELRDGGVLTEEEFAEQKARILNQAGGGLAARRSTQRR